jgi:hypothetical protein
MIEDIKLQALSLQEGESLRITCPQCSRPKMDIKRTSEGILYNCWRPSCTAKGFIGALAYHNTMLYDPKPQKQPSTNPFTEDTTCLTLEFFQEHLSKYEIALSEFVTAGASLAKHRKRCMVMPLLDRHGGTFGKTVKYFNVKEGHRKSIHYLEDDKTPLIHFATYPELGHYAGYIVLVEDWISALKIEAQGYCAAALLGTQLSGPKVKEIKSAGFDHVVIALDPDAQDKAEKIRKEYGLFFDSFYVLGLPDDPKDTPNNQLVKMLDATINL